MVESTIIQSITLIGCSFNRLPYIVSVNKKRRFLTGKTRQKSYHLRKLLISVFFNISVIDYLLLTHS